jgi:hypothetical protein
MWHYAWARLTRHSKTLICPSYMRTVSLRILGFVSDHVGLSALWSHGSWPDYSHMWSRENWGFKPWSSHASLPVYFWLSIQALRCCSIKPGHAKSFTAEVRDVVCTKITQMHIDVSYAAPQSHVIVNVALHREYSRGIVFIFSQGRKDLYHV